MKDSKLGMGVSQRSQHMAICLLCIGLVGVTVVLNDFTAGLGIAWTLASSDSMTGSRYFSFDTPCSIFVIVITPAQTYGTRRCNQLLDLTSSDWTREPGYLPQYFGSNQVDLWYGYTAHWPVLLLAFS